MNRINSEEKEARPFFIIVAAVMVFLYGLTLYTRTDLQKPPAFIVFSVIMALHTILHWFYRIFVRNRRAALIYFSFQSAVAVFLAFYTKELSLIFGLFLPLLGEEVGIFRTLRTVIISVLINCILIAGSLLFYFNTESFNPLTFAGIIPLVFFVIIYVNLYTRQSEAKVRAETLLEELETVNDKLMESNARIEKLSVDQERQRLARELHDTLAQGLSGLILQLEAASVHLKNRNNEKADDIISKAMATARETLSGSREAIDGLRGNSGISESSGEPMFLFLDSQKSFFEAASKKFSFAAAGEPVLDIPQRKHLERIITEVLSNCLQHSDAENVRLELKNTDANTGEGLLLRVTDDGKGFKPDKVPEGHYGLTGIRERCEMLGGSLSIRSSKGRGTTVSIRLPEIRFAESGAFNGGADGR